MKTTLATLALLSGLAATAPAVAQDAAATLAELQALVATGSFEPEEMPAVSIDAEGCALTYTLRSVAPQLGAPLTAVFTFDAREVEPASVAPEPNPERLPMWVPRQDRAPVEVTMILDTEDAAIRGTFSGALGADCSAAGPCTGIQPAPRLPIVFYVAEGEDGMDRARAFSTALSAFAAACGTE